MKTLNNRSEGFRFPMSQGVLPIKGAQIPAKIIAGLTPAALAIPEVMNADKSSDRKKMKPSKELREILKQINPDLKRLLELTDDPGEKESVLFESVRSGARSLRIARRIANKD